MRHTNRQTTTRTLADLYRAIDQQHAVTITVDKEEKDAAGRKTGRLVETVRTLELDEIRTTSEGHILIVGMDRETQDERHFRLDRVRSYTVSRSGYQVQRPQPSPLTVVMPVVTTVADLIAAELGRDRDDADCWTHPTTAALAA